MNLGILPRGFRIFGWLQHGFRNPLRLAFIFSGTNALNLDAGDALAVHFHDREAKIAVLEAFAALGNEAQLVENETTHGGVSRVFRQSDVVLGVEITDIERGVKDQGSIRESERALDNVKFVVNFSHHLFEDVFNGDQPEDAAEFVHHQGHADAASAQFEKQLAGRLGLGDDEHFAQNAAQIERGWREILLEPAFAIEKDPNHIFDMNEAEDVVRIAAIDRNARTLRGGENTHHFIQIRFHGEHVYVRARNHYFAHLNLSKFHGAENELFFAGRDQAAFTGLLNLNLEFLGGMRNTVNLRGSNSQGLHNRARYAVEQMDGPAKSPQEPAKGHGHQQGHALGAGQADGLGNQFPDDYVQCAEESKCAGERDGMSEERGTCSKSSGPNGLKHFCKRSFAERTNRQARKGDAELHAGNDTMQIAEERFDNARTGAPLGDELADAGQAHGNEGKLCRCKKAIKRD